MDWDGAQKYNRIQSTGITSGSVHEIYPLPFGPQKNVPRGGGRARSRPVRSARSQGRSSPRTLDLGSGAILFQYPDSGTNDSPHAVPPKGPGVPQAWGGGCLVWWGQ